jgi:hypothetical protein
VYEPLVTILSSAAVSAALSGALVWLLQNWISERLKNAIKHEYDAKLETHKAQLKAAFDVDVEAHKAKLAAENAAATERLKAELQLAHLREQHKTEYMAEETVHRLLNHKGWIRRSFAAIQNELGGYDGESGDELRRILVRAGARRIFGKGQRSDPKNEWWMLVSRMQEWIDKKKAREARLGQPRGTRRKAPDDDSSTGAGADPGAAADGGA